MTKAKDAAGSPVTDLADQFVERTPRWHWIGTHPNPLKFSVQLGRTEFPFYTSPPTPSLRDIGRESVMRGVGREGTTQNVSVYPADGLPGAVVQLTDEQLAAIERDKNRRYFRLTWPMAGELTLPNPASRLKEIDLNRSIAIAAARKANQEFLARGRGETFSAEPADDEEARLLQSFREATAYEVRSFAQETPQGRRIDEVPVDLPAGCFVYLVPVPPDVLEGLRGDDEALSKWRPHGAALVGNDRTQLFGWRHEEGAPPRLLEMDAKVSETYKRLMQWFADYGRRGNPEVDDRFKYTNE